MSHRSCVKVAIVATAVAAGVTGTVIGLGVSPASAHDGSITVREVFRESVKPFDTIQIPKLCCPPGSYLENRHLAAGRIVPKGLQIIEPGFIGVTNNEVSKENVFSGGTLYPFSSHELVINLSCTTEPAEGARGEWN